MVYKQLWLPFDTNKNYGHLKKWVLEIIGNVCEKLQIVVRSY